MHVLNVVLDSLRRGGDVIAERAFLLKVGGEMVVKRELGLVRELADVADVDSFAVGVDFYSQFLAFGRIAQRQAFARRRPTFRLRTPHLLLPQQLLVAAPRVLQRG